MTPHAVTTTIYKICPLALWHAAEREGVFRGAPIDLKDGFIHFSSAEQVAETAAKHFAGQENLLLLHVDTGRLGDRLTWETSRGGALFPHLYDTLALSAVTKVEALPLGPDGFHQFPALE
jgi:uncharacterized protein (DUF952 family)